MKIQFLRLSLIVLCLPVLWPQMAAADQDRPNIVLILSDDQGVHDVGCYGSEIPTPNIDRIAAEGVKFTSFYSASSICTPSRFGLLTGRNPSRSQDRLLGALMFMAEEDARRGIHGQETTIATVLGRNGYDTALIGKWHLGHGDARFLPLAHGFDRFIGHTGGCIDYFTMTYGLIPDWYRDSQHVSENGYATDIITREAVDYLTARQDADKPFFLYLPYNAPHFGKGWSPADRKTVNLMQAQGEDLKRVAFIEDKVRREFAAMVVSLDDGIGQILDALDAGGLAKNTLVIFLTDHGGDPIYGGNNAPLRGSKATLFEGGIRVPCVMRWPGKIPAGSECGIVAWSIDLFPTFCEMAGAPAAGTKDLALDGASLVSFLSDPDKATIPDREFLWETGSHAELNRNPWRALRSAEGWKYVSSPDEGEYLFNLADDPAESRNLRESEPERFAALRDRARALAENYAREAAAASGE